MKFKIAERYFAGTLTKRSQLCKTKQFFKKIPQHKDKIDKFFKLYLTFRTFDCIRHHSISSAFKNMFQEGQEMLSKKVTKSEIGSKGFNLTKK